MLDNNKIIKSESKKICLKMATEQWFDGKRIVNVPK